MSNVIELPIDDDARARVTVRSFAATYEESPVVENARCLVLATQTWCEHLDALGVTRRSRDAFLDMDADASSDEMVLCCANAILRALRLAEQRRSKRRASK